MDKEGEEPLEKVLRVEQPKRPLEFLKMEVVQQYMMMATGGKSKPPLWRFTIATWKQSSCIPLVPQQRFNLCLARKITEAPPDGIRSTHTGQRPEVENVEKRNQKQKNKVDEKERKKKKGQK